MAKATFTVSVFGLACWNDNGKLRIKVNVRTDQKRQRKLAKLPADSKVLIVDLPGGNVELEDFPDMEHATPLNVLMRKVAEETGGCTLGIIPADFFGPMMMVTNNSDPARPAGDIVFWRPITLHGTPKPTSKVLEHLWVTQLQLADETKYRCVGGLGKYGRIGHMLMTAFDFFQIHRDVPCYFSTPKLSS